MTTRKYSSRAQQTTLSSGITSGDATMTVGSGANLMGGKTPSATETYTVVIDPDTALEEIVDVSNYASGNTLAITRGRDGSTGVAHSAGAVVRHMIIGRDLTEANTHIEGTLAQHAATTSAQLAGVISDETGSGALVFATSPTLVTPALGTPASGTLTNTTGFPAANLAGLGTGIATFLATPGAGVATFLATPSSANLASALTDETGSGAAVFAASPTLTGTVIATNVTASGTVTAALFSGPLTGAVTGNVIGNLTGTVTGAASLNLPLTGGTMSGAINMGSSKITGLGTPTANTTDAATTAYVDTSIANLVAGAPGTLDTLDEIAAALNDTANFSDTVVLKSGSTMTGALTLSGAPTVNLHAATKLYVDSITTAPSNLTGPITSVGPATSVAAQTGTGSTFVMNTSPTLVTPALGVATATTINGTTIPSTVTLVKTSDTLATLSSTTSAQLAGVISDETGSGALVFGTSPSLTTPKITLTYSAKVDNYTFVSGDEGNICSMNAATAKEFRIPTDATFNFAIGTQFNVFWITGAGQPKIVASTPATTAVISTGATSASPLLRVENSMATCLKIAANSWIVIGDIA